MFPSATLDHLPQVLGNQPLATLHTGTSIRPKLRIFQAGRWHSQLVQELHNNIQILKSHIWHHRFRWLLM